MKTTYKQEYPLYLLMIKGWDKWRDDAPARIEEKFGRPCIVFEGIDARKNEVPREHCQQHLKPGEIACAMGHRMMWQALIDSGEPFALFLEDDHKFGDDTTREHFDNALARLCAIDPMWDFVMFQQEADIWGNHIIPHSEEEKEFRPDLYRAKKLHCGTQCYAVSRRGAQYLMEYTNSFYMPIDHYTCMYQYVNEGEHSRIGYPMPHAYKGPSLVWFHESPSIIQTLPS